MPAYTAARPRDAFPKAKAVAQKALELDDTLAQAHTALAMALARYEFDFTQAAREFRRAVELNPNYGTAHHWYGNTTLIALARFDEAIAEMKRALDLDPLSLIANADLGRAYLCARRFDEGIAQLRKTLELDRNFYVAHWMLGQGLEFKGLTNAAIVEYENAHRLDDDPYVLGLLGHAYAVKAAGRMTRSKC
jgi:tetratricopeptide (TPR) repeat protein